MTDYRLTDGEVALLLANHRTSCGTFKEQDLICHAQIGKVLYKVKAQLEELCEEADKLHTRISPHILRDFIIEMLGDY